MHKKPGDILLYAALIALSLAALYAAASTPSFSMNNKAVYQGF